MELSNSMGSTGRQRRSGSTAAANKSAAARRNEPCHGIVKRPSINVNVNVNVHVKRSQAAAAVASQSTHRKPNKASRQKAAPLELLVVGHQVTMRPMFSRMPMPPYRTSTDRSPLPVSGKSQSIYPLAFRAGARAGAVARAGGAAECGLVAGAELAALAGSHILPAGQATAVQLLEDSEFVYVYESYPLEELWTAAQLDMPQESPPCKDKQLQLLQLPALPELPELSVAQQVLDARFLAELCDELLMLVE